MYFFYFVIFRQKLQILSKTVFIGPTHQSKVRQEDPQDRSYSTNLKFLQNLGYKQGNEQHKIITLFWEKITSSVNINSGQ